MDQKKNIIKTLKNHKTKLLSYGVKKIGLFGSFLRAEQREDSDIDLIVEFIPGKKTFDNFMSLSFFLEDIFNRRVELVTPESLSPYIGPHILKEVEYVELVA